MSGLAIQQHQQQLQLQLQLQQRRQLQLEEGFISGSSIDDPSPAYVDRLAYEMSTMELFAHDVQGVPIGYAPKCSSDSGASSGDSHLDHLLGGVSHESGSERMCTGLTVQRQAQQLPGAWFYEMGTEADGSSTADVDFDLIPKVNLPASRNITESVEVPSSEHVAEIVGRQGCKIKALRAKTNTYIKTPVRGEEPVFVVTGRPEDVADSKREIECAAEHFTQIRASRRHSQGGVPAPGHITAYVRVPLRVVGLVVGPKGATIKRIQQDTHTYIITPSREREPIFEVTGLPTNVESARKEIENHIYQRTGNMPLTDPASIGGFEAQPAGVTGRSVVSYGTAVQTGLVRRGSTLDTIVGLQDFPRHAAEPTYTTVLPAPTLRTASISKPYSVDGSPPQSSSSFLTNGSSSIGYFNQYELAAALRTQQQQQHQVQQQQHQDQQQQVKQQQVSSDYSSFLSNYPTWSMGYGVSETTSVVQPQSDLTQLRDCPLFHPANNNTVLPSSIIPRDEGLGESPLATGLNWEGSSSFEPFHLMISSIWSDLENPRDRPSSGLAPVPPHGVSSQ